MAEQDQRISEAIEREQSRLRNFIRRRVADREDAEDVLQDVFYELVEAYRMMKPVEQVTAWLFRVARNRITDLFRKKTAGGVEKRAGDDSPRTARCSNWKTCCPRPMPGRTQLTREACCWKNWTPLWTSCLTSNARYSSPTS